MRELEWESNLVWPGRDRNLLVYRDKASTHHITTSCSHEQVYEMTRFNVDMRAHLQNALYNEATNYISRQISKSVLTLNVNGTEMIDECSLNRAISVMEKHKGFAIGNVRIGAALQDNRLMKMIPTSKQISLNPGLIYQIGSIKNCDIFVDPYLEWNYTGLGLNLNNFYNFWIGEEMYEESNPSIAEKKFHQELYYNFRIPDNIIFNINEDTINI